MSADVRELMERMVESREGLSQLLAEYFRVSHEYLESDNDDREILARIAEGNAALQLALASEYAGYVALVKLARHERAAAVSAPDIVERFIADVLGESPTNDEAGSDAA